MIYYVGKVGVALSNPGSTGWGVTDAPTPERAVELYREDRPSEQRTEGVYLVASQSSLGLMSVIRVKAVTSYVLETVK